MSCNNVDITDTLESWYVESKVLFVLFCCVVKTNGLNSCTFVTSQLIGSFDFAYSVSISLDVASKIQILHKQCYRTCYIFILTLNI